MKMIQMIMPSVVSSSVEPDTSSHTTISSQARLSITIGTASHSSRSLRSFHLSLAEAIAPSRM